MLSASGTGTGTTFTVNEEATAPRVPFVIKVGNELMKVTKRVLVTGTTSQYTYTVARGQGGTSNVTHGTGSEIAWDLLARQDLLGSPTGTVNATTTTFQVQRGAVRCAGHTVHDAHRQRADEGDRADNARRDRTSSPRTP